MHQLNKIEYYRWIIFCAVTASCTHAILFFRAAPGGLPIVIVNAVIPVFLFFYLKKTDANRIGIFLLCSPVVFIIETLYIICNDLTLPLQLALNMLVILFTGNLTLFALCGEQFSGNLKKHLDLYLIPLLISITTAYLLIYSKHPFPLVPYLMLLFVLSGLYIVMHRQIRSNERMIAEQHQSISNNHIMLRGFIHDLGNSIAAASGWSSMALKSATDEKRKINSEKAESAFKHVITHIKTVTTLLKDHGNIVTLSLISPSSFCRELFTFLQKSYVGELVAKKNGPVTVTTGVLTFSMPSSFKGKLLYADTESFGRAILNLISNAKKAGATGITIAIGEISDPAGLQIRIIDNGRGIPEETTLHLFKDRIASENGSGVGLLGVRMIVRGHDATIEVADPNSDGTGHTEFVVKNLLYRPPGNPVPARPDPH